MNEHPVVLIVETSGRLCSVAITHRTGFLSRVLKEPLQHASHLAPLVREAMQEASLSFTALQAVAVSIGPGSYTGLRIGLSFAKGLCQATGARLMALPTFEILRLSLFQAHPEAAGKSVVLCLPSKKDHLYITAFDAEGHYILPPENYAREAWSRLAEALLQNCVVAGSGAGTFADALGLDSERVFETVEPVAEAAVPLVLKAWRDERFDSLHDTAPLYLSGFSPRQAPPSVFVHTDKL